MLLRIIFRLKLPMFLLLPYLIPFAFLVWFVTNFGVNAPYADQWELVPLLQNIVSGKATFQEFFAQHNEHRILFPRLIMSALALISGWNTQWELHCSVVLAAIVFLLLFKISFDQAQQHNQLFHLANFSTCCIVFSVIQWENWLWGFQLSWFLTNVCLAVAILAFSSKLGPTLRAKLAVAALACFVASFSLAHGLLTWIAVLPSLRSCCKDARQFRNIGLLWLILFLITCCLYFSNYHKPSFHPDLWFFLKQPNVAATYFLTLLGSPLLYSSNFSFTLGLAALLNFGFFVVRYAKNTGSKFSHDAAPWLSLGCFAILFDLMTTIGRAGFGADQSKSSRYTTVAILLLVALVQLWRVSGGLISSKLDSAVATTSQAGPRHSVSTPSFVIGLLTFLVLVASINSLPAAEANRSRLQYGQACLEVADYVPRSPGNCLQWLYPDTNRLIERTKVLNQIGLRHFPGKTIGLAAESTKVYGYLDAPATGETAAIVRKNCLNCGMVAISGWAVLPEGKLARLVFIGRGRHPETFLTTANVNLSSPDVAKTLGIERYKQVRWQTTVPLELLPLGKTVLTAWVYDPDGKQFVKLRGEPMLSVEE